MPNWRQYLSPAWAGVTVGFNCPDWCCILFALSLVGTSNSYVPILILRRCFTLDLRCIFFNFVVVFETFLGSWVYKHLKHSSLKLKKEFIFKKCFEDCGVLVLRFWKKSKLNQRLFFVLKWSVQREGFGLKLIFSLNVI